MKTSFLAVILLLIVRTGFACHTHNSDVNSINASKWGEIKSIELRSSVNLIIKEGKENDVMISDEQGTGFADVRITTEKNKLIISSRGNDKASKKVNVYITVKDLRQIISSGTGEIFVDETLTGDRIDLRIYDSGNIHAVLDTRVLRVTISGSGNLEVSGRTQESDIKITGSGNVFGKELRTSTSNINITGSGSSTVDVIDDLTINITGSGNVYFLSYPERMNAKSKSIGQVEKIKA